MRILNLSILALLLATTPALAGTLTVRVTDSAGKPARDVVVALHAIGRADLAPRLSGTYQVSQKDTQFHPFISVVPVGAKVSFPNFDPFKHHVYSFSPIKRFELKLFAKDQTRSVTFDKPGVVAIGCNIHDSMSAFIYVTDTPFAESVGATGEVSFQTLPAGRYTLSVWHPYLNAPGNQLSHVTVMTNADRTENVAVRFRPPPMHNMSSY